MRHNSVVIKTNAYGLVIHLDKDLSFEELQKDLGDKFREAAKFFRNAQMAVTFTGRQLTSEEELSLISTITENAQIHIVCLVDESREHAETYKDAVIRTLEKADGDLSRVVRGDIRNGQSVESEMDLIVLGDVNPGGTAKCSGSLIVLGCAMGNLYAGLDGRPDAFIAALTLKPALLRIGDKAARSAITKREDPGDYPIDPKIARVEADHLVMEPLKGSSFQKLMPS